MVCVPVCGVIDDSCVCPSSSCAGKQTINSMYGTRVAVLAGDFLFAQSSWFLANLDNLEVGVTHTLSWW